MKQPRDARGRFLSPNKIIKPAREPAPLVKRQKVFEYKPASLGSGICKILFVPDIQFPKHDPRAMDVMIRSAQQLGPNIIVLAGDVNEVDILSYWKAKERKRKIKLGEIKESIHAENLSAKPYLNELCEIADEGVYWLEGNHEARRRNLFKEYPELRGDPRFEPREFFELNPAIEWIPESYRLKIGNCYFEHGHKILNTRGSKTIAESMHQRRPHSNTFTGHWHCVDRYTRVEYAPDNTPSPHTTATCGHLSNPDDHHYVNLPNWTQGWGEIVMWLENGKPRFSFDQIELMDYKYARRGKIIS